ncbi:MAG: dolichyl-phosphate beta-glucosyltransferase [Candidatus Polarisedimenticolia bacterium]
MQPPPRLSVVIPAYNEASRIGAGLDRSCAWLSGRSGGPFEIVVVDDGSTDATPEAVRRAAAAAPPGVAVRLLQNGRNRGKGYSVKHGVLLSAGEFLLLSDADFSTPIEELPRLLEPVERGECAIAVGSRGLPGSRVEIHQPLWRETMGRCFNLLVRALTGLPFADTQCGFKVLRRRDVLPLFRAARVERFAYDVEILYLARRAGLRVLEVPVIWRNAPGSKVNALFDSLGMLKDIVRVVVRARRGRYGDLRRGLEPAGGGR